MMTAVQCLAKADEMDQRAAASADAEARGGYKAIALHWRQAATLARHQEAWANAHEDA